MIRHQFRSPLAFVGCESEVLPAYNYGRDGDIIYEVDVFLFPLFFVFVFILLFLLNNIFCVFLRDRVTYLTYVVWGLWETE